MIGEPQWCHFSFKDRKAVVGCDLVDVCIQGWPPSYTDICPYGKLGSLSLEMNILLSGKRGIALDIALRCWVITIASSGSTTRGVSAVALSPVLLAPEGRLLWTLVAESLHQLPEQVSSVRVSAQGCMTSEGGSQAWCVLCTTLPHEVLGSPEALRLSPPSRAFQGSGNLASRSHRRVQLLSLSWLTSGTHTELICSIYGSLTTRPTLCADAGVGTRGVPKKDLRLEPSLSIFKGFYKTLFPGIETSD